MPGSSVLSDLDKSPSAFGCDGNGTEREPSRVLSFLVSIFSLSYTIYDP